MNKNSIVQRLASGNLTEDEKRGYSEYNSQYGTENPLPREPRKVSFALDKFQKIAVYQDVRDRIMNGASPNEVSAAVLACIEQHLQEKEDEAYDYSPYGEVASFAKGKIRRVE